MLHIIKYIIPLLIIASSCINNKKKSVFKPCRDSITFFVDTNGGIRSVWWPCDGDSFKKLEIHEYFFIKDTSLYINADTLKDFMIVTGNYTGLGRADYTNSWVFLQRSKNSYYLLERLFLYPNIKILKPGKLTSFEMVEGKMKNCEINFIQDTSYLIDCIETPEKYKLY